MVGRYPEIKDHIRGNPVSMMRPTALQPYQTEKAKAWSDDEMNAIRDSMLEGEWKIRREALE
jgi:hypothetical protein